MRWWIPRVSTLWIPLLALSSGMWLRSTRNLDVVGYALGDRMSGGYSTYSITSVDSDVCLAFATSGRTVSDQGRLAGWYGYTRSLLVRTTGYPINPQWSYGFLGIEVTKESDAAHNWRRLHLPY